MGLLSIFQRKVGPGARSAFPQDAVVVAAERARARRRLVGAVVLVLAGVIGFPLLFDTAPRPLPLDIPIEIPGRDGAPPLATGSAGRMAKGEVTGADPQASAAAPVSPQPATAPAPEGAAERAAELPAGQPADKPAEKPTEKPTEKPGATDAAAAAAKQADAARAQAALEGKPAPAQPVAAAKATDADGRFVVQVGAFSEPGSAREARARVEKLGFKTYTQVVDTSAGKRIRVRVGPFDDRAEAEKVAAKMKQAGIASAVRAP